LCVGEDVGEVVGTDDVEGVGVGVGIDVDEGVREFNDVGTDVEEYVENMLVKV
jgi:hypothetical protein